MSSQTVASKMTFSGKLADKKWGWLMALGILSIVLGMFAVATPWAASLAVGMFVGVFLLLTGIIGIVQAFKVKGVGSVIWHLFIGLMYTVAGFSLLATPVESVITLTLFLSIVFIISGVSRVVMAFTHRKSNQNWAMILLSGVITTVLGVMLLNQWPASSFWAMGLFLGVDLLFSGFSTLSLSLVVKQLEKKTA